MGRRALIVLDTHAWLWWFAGDQRLSPQALSKIEEEDTIGICTISCWEVAMLTTKGRLTLDRPPEQWIQQALAIPGIEPLELSANAAALAGTDRLALPGDPADRMIVATAIEHEAPLVTKDQRLAEIENLQTIW